MSEFQMHHPETGPANSRLEIVRQEAIKSLTEYMDSPGEKLMREHQSDVIQDIRDDLQEGFTEGYIHLPTGSGKTIVATELARVLDRKTVIVSPTKLILGQTSDKAQQFSPGISMTNYYSDEKDLTGKVINTTYHSLQNLIESGELDPEEIELLIADELHTALGPARHTIFSKFTNALMVGLDATPEFSKLDFYQRMGIVDKEERWTNIFKRKYHEMTKEEAIERGVLAQIDVHLLRTLSTVGDVHINAGGNYSEADKNRYLNREIRNTTALGLLAGLDMIPPGVNLDEQTLANINELHQQIKGKRTVYFGYSIEHVEEMAARLREAGLTAAAVHGDIPEKARNSIFAQHDAGKVQVILGVDLIRLGWDSPKTEVGLFYDITQSPVNLEQALGRIMRPSPESGKERAIAIQPVDTFLHRNQEPLLLPYLFDPYHVLRGSRHSDSNNRSGGKQQGDKLKMTFSGIEMKALLENYSTNEILQNRFKSASFDEVEEYIQKMLQIITLEQYPEAKADGQEENTEVLPEFDLLGIYERLVEEMPARISQEFADKAMQAVASLDSNLAKRGGQILVFTYMGSILSGVKDYFTDNRDLNNDIVESAVVAVIAKALRSEKGFSGKQSLASQIYTTARLGAAEFVASETSMNKSWVNDRSKYTAISQLLEDAGVGSGRALSIDEMESILKELTEQTGISEYDLYDFIKYQNQKSIPVEVEKIDVDTERASEKEREKRLLYEEIKQVFGTLDSRERVALDMRFGLSYGGEALTLRQISDIFGISTGRVGQVEAKALRKMRHPSRSNVLRPFHFDIDPHKLHPEEYNRWLFAEGFKSMDREWEKWKKQRRDPYTNIIDEYNEFSYFYGSVIEPLRMDEFFGFKRNTDERDVGEHLAGKLRFHIGQNNDEYIQNWYKKNRGNTPFLQLPDTIDESFALDPTHEKKLRSELKKEKDYSIAHLELNPQVFLMLVLWNDVFGKTPISHDLTKIASLKQAVQEHKLPKWIESDAEKALEKFYGELMKWKEQRSK